MKLSVVLYFLKKKKNLSYKICIILLTASEKEYLWSMLTPGTRYRVSIRALLGTHLDDKFVEVARSENDAFANREIATADARTLELYIIVHE